MCAQNVPLWGGDVTHPVRQIHLPLLRNKLQHPRMCHLLLRAVDQLKQHRIRDMHPRELVQRAGWQEDLSPMVCALPLRARHHGDGVAAEVLVEAAGRHAAGASLGQGVLVHGHGVARVVVAWVRL